MSTGRANKLGGKGMWVGAVGNEVKKRKVLLNFPLNFQWTLHWFNFSKLAVLKQRVASSVEGVRTDRRTPD